MPTKFFGTVRPECFDGKTWYPPVCIKVFDAPNFLRHWRNAHEIFRHCETKKFWRNFVMPPIKHITFRYPKFSETLNGCPRNFSTLWDKKLSTENCDTPLMHKIVRYPQFSETLKECPRNVSALWDKKVSTENCDTHIMHKIVRYPKFSETMKGCPRNVSALWDQNFPTGKRDTPVFIHKTFWKRNFSQKQWGSLTKVFGTVRQKIFDGKLRYPLLSINVFDTPIFLKPWTDPHKIFWHCETKTFRRQNVIPPFSSIKLFETEIFLRNSGIL